MPHKMNEDEYLSVINSFEANAIQFNANFNKENEELQRRYKGELYGDEQPERSKVVSNDVADVVEADMPSLARNFLGAKKPCVFQTNSTNEDEIREAQEKTEYVDWIVRQQEDSFRVQHGFLKDIEIQKMGALKYFIEDVTTKETINHEDISFEELAGIEDSLESEDAVNKFEITERSEIKGEGDSQRLDVTFEITRVTRRPRVIGVPLESLLISSNATCEDDANLVGDSIKKTRGELLAEGIDIKVVAKLPKAGQNIRTNENSSLPDIRFSEDGGIQVESFSDWSNEKVWISDLYVMIDKDGNGVAERRHILKSGNVILEDEPFPLVPYAITSAILMSHTINGRSRAEITAPSARIKTTLTRGLLDNSYAHNAPQIGVNDNVNLDDLLVKRPNGIVRTKGERNPGESIFPMNIEYIGDKALQVIQYIDHSLSKTAGTMQASQGLQPDQFEKETATRFVGMQDASQAKIELVVRVIAETAYCRMYAGLAVLVSHFQTTEVEIMVLGKPLTINPANWKFKHRPKSALGLGSGDGERTTETLSAVYNIQTQLKSQGSALVDEVKIYNTLDAILKSVDIHNTGEFFNNPERPEDLIVAENEQLRGQLEQAKQIIEQQTDDFQKAAQTTAQAKLIEAQGKAGLEAAKITEDSRQFDDKQEQDQHQHDQDLSFDLLELEAKTGKDIPGGAI